MFLSEAKYLTLELLLDIVPLELMNIARMVWQGACVAFFHIVLLQSQPDTFQEKLSISAYSFSTEIS